MAFLSLEGSVKITHPPHLLKSLFLIRLNWTKANWTARRGLLFWSSFLSLSWEGIHSYTSTTLMWLLALNIIASPSQDTSLHHSMANGRISPSSSFLSVFVKMETPPIHFRFRLHLTYTHLPSQHSVLTPKWRSRRLVLPNYASPRHPKT